MARLSLFPNNQDPREVPLYGVAQAACYFDVPLSTLRTWIVGQEYLESQGRTGRFPALITPAGKSPTRLSFNNLAELQVVETLRRIEGLDLSKIRRAIRNLPGAHPLIEHELRTDRTHIYVGDRPLIEVSSGDGRQLAIRDVLKDLKYVERDSTGRVSRLFPDPDRRVMIDPRVSFGKPTMVGTRVTVAVLADFIRAGESMKRVANEFDLDEKDVRAAVGWFRRDAA